MIALTHGWIRYLIVSIGPALMVAAQAAPIAKATFVIGDVRARNAQGIARPLVRDNPLEAGETVITGPRSVAQLIFVDQTRVAIRPTSEVGIDQFNYSADTAGETDSMVLRLARGALRSVTGLIGIRNHQHFSLNTPVATIGIRGTDFEAVHIPEEGGFGEGKIPPGTYNKVYTGGTVMTTKAGVIELKINETGFVGLGAKAVASVPTKIDQLPPEIVKVINSVPMPVADVDKNEESSVRQNTPRKGDEGAPLPPIAEQSQTPPAGAPAPTDGPAVQPDADGTTRSLLPKGDPIYTKLPTAAPRALEGTPLKTLDGAALKSITTDIRTATTAPQTVDTTNAQVAPTVQSPTTFQLDTKATLSPTTVLSAPITTLSPTTVLSAPITTLSPTTTIKTLSPTITNSLQLAPSLIKK